MYHYTYLIEDTNSTTPKYLYHGVRSSKCLPQDDPYMGSCNDPLYHKSIKERPVDFIKHILTNHCTRIEAEHQERLYHAKHDVASASSYWNAYNANEGFSTVGMVTARNIKTGETRSIHQGELKGDWIANSKDMVCVLDLVHRDSYRISKDEFDENPNLLPANFESVKVTPWGNYASIQDAVDGSPSKISEETMKKVIRMPDHVVTYAQSEMNWYFTGDMIGKTHKDIGFDCVPYIKDENEDLMIDLLDIDPLSPKHSLTIERENKKLANTTAREFGTHVIKTLLVTPFGRAPRKMFPDFLLKAIGNDTYSTISKALNVTDWNGDGYYFIKYKPGVNESEMYNDYEEPPIIKELKKMNDSIPVRMSSFRGLYIAPTGTFFTVRDVEKSLNGSVAMAHIYRNKLDVVITHTMVERSKYLKIEHVDKTWRDLGFSFVEYE
jgi:hypothetical protein